MKVANSPTYSHKKAWMDYAKKNYSNNFLGIWHETYEISPNQVENIYVGMAPFGLSSFGEVEPISSHTQFFEQRFKKQTKS